MIFQFRAYLANGREERGAIEATNKQEALRALDAKGLRAFFLQEISPKAKAINTRNIARFRLVSTKINPTRLFYDLALLTDAGLTITQALRSMRATEQDVVQGAAIDAIEAAMSSGKTASQSFSQISEIPPDALGLIASGESAARLPAVFKALAAQHEERQKARAAMISALTYPIFLMVVMMLAIGVITFVLVPSIEPIFENADRSPPFIIFALSQLRLAVEHYSIQFIVFLIVLGCSSFLPLTRKIFNDFYVRLVLKLPIVGLLIRKRGLSQYLSSLSMLLEHGGTMASALLLCAQSNPAASLKPKFLTVRDKVTTGSTLMIALRESNLFDERILSLIAVGDDANKLPLVLARAAQLIELEAQARLTKFLAMLSPAVTIALGFLIGGLVVSVMSALLSINDLALQ